MPFDYKQLEACTTVQTYGRYDVCLQSGKNATATGVDGRRYIDFTSGIGVNALGYANDGWVAAVCEQAARLQHVSNLYYTEPVLRLAERLTRETGYDKAFFANSGAEANECAIKAARKYSVDRYGKTRTTILTLNNSFHGRTVTTLAATGQPAFHDFFFPFTEGFRHLPANDPDGFAAALTDDVCAVMLEFIQGEGGVIPLDAAFVRTVAKLCAERDILLIADEVQTGIGRTGTLLAGMGYGVKPDLTTLAKGLGGGLPIGAVLFNQKTSGVLQKGQHGTTFGGNPVVCAGALAVLDTVCDDGFLQSVAEKGAYIQKRLLAHPEVAGVDGTGLMLGVRLKTKQAGAAASACAQNGLLILTAKEKLRLLPPLTITYDEIDAGLEILSTVLSE